MSSNIIVNLILKNILRYRIYPFFKLLWNNKTFLEKEIILSV